LGNVVGLGHTAMLLGGVNQHAFNLGMIRSNAGIYYIVTAFLVLAGVLITVFGVREIPLLTRKPEITSKKGKTLLELARYFMHEWTEPWRSNNFRMVFLARVSLRNCLKKG